ncbi:T9SS type A sorting domain-containing protein [Rubrivirga sp. IMCC43871]|uniref:T9SS type A sorting domain-containing protein n=1 Tax=Rubrivirga sp. IMCC43871 TaxID=3391575 RepID=UPI0039902838
MRAFLAVLLAVASGPALAQVVPDTTDPARYVPLVVENEWQYERYVSRDSGGEDVEYRRHRMVDAATVDGVTYRVVARDRASMSVPAWDPLPPDTVRFDPDRSVVVRLLDGVETEISCPLAADFGATVDCGSLASQAVVGREQWEGQTRKTYTRSGDARPFAAYVADVGAVRFEAEPALADVVPLDPFGLAYRRDAKGIGTGFPLAPEALIDPTPPHLYYPLTQGYVRETQAFDGILPLFKTRTEIVRDTVALGQRYAIERRFTVLGVYDSQSSWGLGITRLLRYDSLTTRIVLLQADGAEVPITPPFGADFGVLLNLTGQPLPDGREGDVVVFGSLHARQDVAGQSLAIAATKSFLSVPVLGYNDFGVGGGYGAGIGALPATSLGIACTTFQCTEAITYLRLVADDGAVEEYGAPLPVSEESSPGSRTLALAASPNPTAGSLALALDVPQTGAVTIEVFDALGRRVWRHHPHLGGGTHRVSVDAGQWASGLYVVRATADGETATATVVRR